jgi:thiosulfate reductase cytochrome b subunit
MQHKTMPRVPGHARWVRISHGLITIAFLLLAFTGVEMLMVHPRLYWGETGNDLTPALFELPVSRNYKHNGWTEQQAFFDQAGSPVSAGRTYDIFNQNGWGRSLHFLAGWLLVTTGLVYLFFGLFSGHFRRNILPARSALTGKSIRADIVQHLRMALPSARGEPQYGLLQRITYAGVVFFALPLMVVTGFSMAPTITARFPFLLDIWGGYQSARTIHFFATIALFLFLGIHLFMVVRTGFRRQVSAMTIGNNHG